MLEVGNLSTWYSIKPGARVKNMTCGINPRRDQVDVMAEAAVGLQAPQPCPFREYLKSEQSEGKTEFRIVLKSDNTFYIHPLGKDGTSRDFVFSESDRIEYELLNTATPLIADPETRWEPVPEVAVAELPVAVANQLATPTSDLPDPGTV